jgi:hypothetical protein
VTAFSQFLTQIFTPAATIAALYWLAKFAIKHVLARNLEMHKAGLSAASTREIESLKAELSRVAREHDVVFQRLHGERAEVIKDLYLKVRALSKAAKAYAARQGTTTAEDHDRNRKSVEAAADNLNQSMLAARIFLPEDLCARIQSGMHDIIGFATNIAGEWLPPLKSPEEGFAAMMSNKKNLEEAAWNMETELATEFRKLLGVN